MAVDQLHRRDLASMLGLAASGFALSRCVTSAQAAEAVDGPSTVAGEAVVVATVLGAPPSETRTGVLATKTSSTIAGGIVTTFACAVACTARNNQGGGLFYWNPEPVVDDGGTVIVPVPIKDRVGIGAHGPGWVRLYSGHLNLTWFGAIGNGADDDTVALQNAVCAAQRNGSTVLIPTGTFRLTGPLRFANAGGQIAFSGGGFANTTIVLDHDADCFASSGGSCLAIVENLTVKTRSSQVSLRHATWRL